MEVLPLILRIIGEEKTTAQSAYGANQSDSLACGSTTVPTSASFTLQGIQ